MKRPSPILGSIFLAFLLLAGCGAVSGPVKDVPPPPAEHYVTLSWTGSSNANHYNVFRTTISGGYYGLIGSTPELTFKDQDVISGETYYYVCTTVDSAGRESSRSNEAKATIS